MSFLLNKLRNVIQSRVTGLGLSIFRIFISIILFIEVSKLFYFRHLYFDPIPYAVESEVSFSLVLLGWLAVLLLLMVGLYTRITAAVNYVLVLVFFSSFTTFKYHFDTGLIGLSFMLMVLPVAKSLSIDSLRYKLRTLHEEEQKVRKVYYYLPVLLILGLQYLDSVFHKGASEVWQNGLGVWLPASLPNQVYSDYNWQLNQKVVMQALGYLVLLFEALFLFLLPFRKLRLWLIAMGVGMHLGIAFVFPIPTFGVTFAGLYLLLLPIGFWDRFSSSKSIEGRAGVLTYDPGDKVAQRAKIILQHFDIRKNIVYTQSIGAEGALSFKAGDGSNSTGTEALRQAMSQVWLLWPLRFLLAFPQFERLFLSVLKHGPVQRQALSEKGSYQFQENLKVRLLQAFVVYLVLAQLLMTVNAPLVRRFSDYTGTGRVRQYIESITFPLAVINNKLLGISENIIFSGFREGSYQILAVEYTAEDGKRTWLPIVDKLGMADAYSFGRMFTKWGRTISAYPEDVAQVKDGLVRYTAFWAAKNQVSLEQAFFVVYAKEVDIVLEWRQDHLHKQLAKPWESIGTLGWKDQEPHLWLHKLKLNQTKK